MIDIKQEPCLTFNFRVVGFIMALVGSMIIFGMFFSIYEGHFINALETGRASTIHILAGPCVLVLGLIVLTSHYRLQVDPSKKTYTEYVWLIGYKSGKPISFNYIEKIYVNKVKEKGVFTSRAGLRYDIKNETHKAFMKLDNGEKIHLDTDKDIKKLEAKIAKYLISLKEVYNPSQA
jgi:hypothetical protein